MATNYAAAVSVAKRLSNAKLLTYEGWGHVASQQSSTCVRTQASRYLLDLKLPAVESCQPEGNPFP